MGVTIIGVVIFCFGVFCMVQEQQNWPALAIAIVGLSIAFRGLADFTARLVIQAMRREEHLTYFDESEFDEPTQVSEHVAD